MIEIFVFIFSLLIRIYPGLILSLYMCWISISINSCMHLDVDGVYDHICWLKFQTSEPLYLYLLGFSGTVLVHGNKGWFFFNFSFTLKASKYCSSHPWFRITICIVEGLFCVTRKTAGCLIPIILGGLLFSFWQLCFVRDVTCILMRITWQKSLF